VFIGRSAGAGVSSGSQNIAIGCLTLGVATVTGADNIGMGYRTMDAMTSGACKIGIGRTVLGASTTGCRNIGIGLCAMGAGDTTANYNVAIGGLCPAAALTTGKSNIAIGLCALSNSTTGCTNIAIGCATMVQMQRTHLLLVSVTLQLDIVHLMQQHLVVGILQWGN
jgi:hypothetical protein